MPELPEVETMRRRIAPVVGCKIRDVKRLASHLRSISISPRLDALRRRITGQKIVGLDRLGKRIILELEQGDRIIIEPRMTGLLLLNSPPEQEHLRLIFQLAGGAVRRLLFWDQRGLGVVRLVAPEQFCAGFLDRIGPDALRIKPGFLEQRLGNSRRAIKVALMDQKIIAGVGNLYASEILHRAHIHPASACCKLTPTHWKNVYKSLRKVLAEAIEKQGSTLSDGTYRAAHDEPGGFQHLHRVYQRAGKKCVQCAKAEIVRIVQAQRSSFFCPACQRKF
ncbi:MAG: bifunctional DNA-formamidopyrimidine glycosylase/DNA-(apurinic or apyrimidinic site) lyase [Thermoguttaceae bacterium]